MSKKHLIFYLDTITVAIISIALILFPVLFFINTTDFFVFPKQLFIVFVVLLLAVLWGIKMVVQKKLILVSNPFSLPILIFAAAVLVSSLFSRNLYDSVLQTVPLLCGLLLFFVIVNIIRDKRSFNFALSSLIIGGAAASLISILYNFKIYFLPIPVIQTALFTTFGSQIQQLLYMVPLFVLSFSYLLKNLGFPKLKLSNVSLQKDQSFIIHLIVSVIVGAGIVLLVVQIATAAQKPIVLPYIYGFQIAFASLSQDAARFIMSLLFGSGYGTFQTDFTRFRLPSFNLEQNLWNLSFSYSSSYVLELVATTGLAGIISYLFIVITAIKMRTIDKNPIFSAIIIAFVLSFLLPFAYVVVVLIFVLLAFYTVFLHLEDDKRVGETTLSIVALKKGIFSFESGEGGRREETVILPAVVLGIILAITVFVWFYSFKLFTSDIHFSQSLQQANLNNGQKTYDLQTKALQEFPYRSDYHRIFSQVNLALAGSLVSSIPQGATAAPQLQQNVVTLLQQSIGSARNAITISPLTSLNWQNLAQVYRNLINVGQNAEQFSIASMNQAITLDPSNPQLYIQLGGIYYQLNQFEPAQNQFQLAVNLKRDFINGYYNLGHAFESKNDLQNALAAYQIVKQLSVGNKENLDKINGEIDALQKKIGQAQSEKQTDIEPGKNQPPLTLPISNTEFPPQKTPIKVSPPPAATVQKPSTTPSPSQAQPSPTITPAATPNI